METSEDKLFFTIDGKEYCNEPALLSELLGAGILFSNEREYLFDGANAGSTIVLFVQCNDLFWWGTADAMDLPLVELPKLYKMWKADPKWGVEKWCCFQRKLRPQKPIIEMMKKQGAWGQDMEALDDPGDS